MSSKCSPLHCRCTWIEVQSIFSVAIFSANCHNIAKDGCLPFSNSSRIIQVDIIFMIAGQV